METRAFFKKHAALFGLIIFILILVTLTHTKKDDGSHILIGGAFALTGDAASWGEAERNGATLAVEEINERGGVTGHSLDLRIEDTGTSATKTVSAVQKLISVDQASVIIGPSWLDSFGGASPLSEQHNVLFINPSGSVTAVQGEKIYPNIFSTWYRSDKQVADLVKKLSAQGITNLAVVVQNDSFWLDAVAKLEAAGQEFGVKIQKTILPVGSLDYRTQLAAIKSSQPQAVFFGLVGEKDANALLKQRNELGLSMPFYTTEWISDLAGQEDFKSLLSNTFYIGPGVLDADFVAKYKARFNVDPVFSASNAYDSVYLLADAYKHTKSLDTAELRSYLAGETFDTISFGKTSFDELGGVQATDFTLYEFKDGAYVPVE